MHCLVCWMFLIPVLGPNCKNRLSMLLVWDRGHLPCLSLTSSDIGLVSARLQQMKRFLFLNELFLHGGPGVLRLWEQQAVFDFE